MTIKPLVIVGLYAAIMLVAFPATAQTWTLTPYGLGPIKVGMSVEEVAKAIGKPVVLKDDRSDDLKACAQMPLLGLPGVLGLFENQKLTSLWLVPESKLKTSQGIGVGDSEANVKAAYPRIAVTDADFDDAPAANLTYWIKKDVAGIEFRINTSRRVAFISAGGHSIQYTEGCL